MTTTPRWLAAALSVALAVLDLGCSESDSLTGPRAAPTPAAGLVFASGIVRDGSPTCTHCGLAAVRVKVQGNGINVSTESGADGRWQLPPFEANVPIELVCTRPGFITGPVEKNPKTGYAPPPGTYTDWGCRYDGGTRRVPSSTPSVTASPTQKATPTPSTTARTE